MFLKVFVYSGAETFYRICQVHADSQTKFLRFQLQQKVKIKSQDTNQHRQVLTNYI